MPQTFSTLPDYLRKSINSSVLGGNFDQIKDFSSLKHLFLFRLTELRDFYSQLFQLEIAATSDAYNVFVKNLDTAQLFISKSNRLLIAYPKDDRLSPVLFIIDKDFEGTTLYYQVAASKLTIDESYGTVRPVEKIADNYYIEIGEKDLESLQLILKIKENSYKQGEQNSNLELSGTKPLQKVSAVNVLKQMGLDFFPGGQSQIDREVNELLGILNNNVSETDIEKLYLFASTMYILSPNRDVDFVTNAMLESKAPSISEEDVKTVLEYIEKKYKVFMATSNRNFESTNNGQKSVDEYDEYIAKVPIKKSFPEQKGVRHKSINPEFESSQRKVAEAKQRINDASYSIQKQNEEPVSDNHWGKWVKIFFIIFIVLIALVNAGAPAIVNVIAISFTIFIVRYIFKYE